MKVYLNRNGFEGEDLDDLNELANLLNHNREGFKKLSFSDIIGAWSELGNKTIKNPELMNYEGIFYLARWLRYENLSYFFNDCLGIEPHSREFKILKRKSEAMAVPRGIVAGWVAGNTLTLPIFAIAQATIVKNSCIIRASKNNLELAIKIIKQLKNNNNDAAKTLIENIAIVYFPHEDVKSHEKLSRIADCKAIWGSAETVSFIKNLPEKDHCECVIFGPKYSIAVIDKESMTDANFKPEIDKLAMDIITFDQMACSSPQTIFVEKSSLSLKEIAKILAESLRKISAKYPKKFIREDIASKIIKKRNEYLLNPELDVVNSPENDWTILIGGEMKLEEAVQSRTVFLKEVESLLGVKDLINPKIQTVCMIVKGERKKELAKEYYYKGAARCVSAGETNEYGWPWDGMFVLDRLIRWCSFS